MNFSELLEQIQKIQYQEKRPHTADYIEVVVAKPHWEAMDQVVQSCFGAPLKPPGQNPSHDAEGYAKSYGGVRRDQTLYFQKNETGSYAALLWPWGNGTSVTLKIIHWQLVLMIKH